MLSELSPKRGLKYHVALQYRVLRCYGPRRSRKIIMYRVRCNIVLRLSSFNLFRLCKVEKLRQTALISFPVFFQSLSPFFVLITI